MNRTLCTESAGETAPEEREAPVRGFTAARHRMDIARPDRIRQQRRRRLAWLGLGLGMLGAITVLLSRLEPSVPAVERGSLWTNLVQRGEMLRQVRGTGTLVPEQIQIVQAENGGTVERILIQPGAEVAADSILLELGNPELRQQAFDAVWAVKAAEAQLTRLSVTLESERLAQEAALATLQADARQAFLEAQANETLGRDGLVPALELEKTQARRDALAHRVQIETQRLQFASDSARAQLAVQEADVEKLRAIRDLRNRQVAALTVRAGIDGVLSQIGEREMLQRGQHVAPGAVLARVIVPSRLKAEIRVAETQARDVTRGQKVDVDTRHGVVEGRVIRVDPAVQGGTVLVEVALVGPLPKGARPDLSVEGTVELERLPGVLHVGRPVQAQADGTVQLFKLVDGGRYAVRVPVRLGRVSVSSVEVLGGLEPGDVVVLNDMSQYDTHDRLKLE